MPDLEAGHSCGGRGIRTLDSGLNHYDGLANRCLQPLGHPSGFRRSAKIVTAAETESVLVIRHKGVCRAERCAIDVCQTKNVGVDINAVAVGIDLDRCIGWDTDNVNDL